jgi:hypothetical protein
MFNFLRCVGEAIAEKGVRGFLSEIPVAGVLIEMGFDINDRWRRRREEARARAEIEAAVQSGVEQLRQAAHELTVSPSGRPSINDAIRAAPPRSRILVGPGVYHESVVIDRPVEIVGDGPRADIVIESHDGDAVVMMAREAGVRGLTLRCRAGANGHAVFAVDVPMGRLLLEDCDITSDSLACVGLHGSLSRPVVRGCLIHGGAKEGVLAYDGASGLFEDCEIRENALAGVVERDGGTATLRGCRVEGNGGGG